MTALNYTPLRQRLALIDRFKAVLARAMEQRDARMDFVDTTNGPELAWVLFERQAMLDEVNQVRAELGQPEVTAAIVARAEQQAVGHVDYHQKYALYCTEIALGDPLWTAQHGEPR